MALPELPWDTRQRLLKDYGLSERDAEVLLNVDSGREVKFDGEEAEENSGAVAYFDRLCRRQSTRERPRDPKVVVNW